MSNSILLRKGRTEIHWDEEEEQQQQQHTTSDHQPAGWKADPSKKSKKITHQKICQTETVHTDTKFIQATMEMCDFAMQVHPNDFQQLPIVEKRPLADRLDWSMRETFDHTPKIRDSEDLRWSLNNTSQKRVPQQPPWNSRGISPPRRLSPARPMIDHLHGAITINTMDHGQRNVNMNMDSLRGGRDDPRLDNYMPHHANPVDEFDGRKSYSPTFTQAVEMMDEYTNNRSPSRGRSPMMREESPDELEIIEERGFEREQNWNMRGEAMGGKLGSIYQMRGARGNPAMGRNNGPQAFRGGRGGGNYRAKF